MKHFGEKITLDISATFDDAGFRKAVSGDFIDNFFKNSTDINFLDFLFAIDESGIWSNYEKYSQDYYKYCDGDGCNVFANNLWQEIDEMEREIAKEIYDNYVKEHNIQ